MEAGVPSPLRIGTGFPGRSFKSKSIAGLLALVALAGCVSSERVSEDSDYNYAMVFKTMQSPMPTVVHSRLERYDKDFGLWKGSERNGEWEFEILAPQAWVDEVKIGFKPIAFENAFRRPKDAWWTPTAEGFDAYEMPYSSYPAAHLYVEKAPKDNERIRVFIQRH